MKKIKQASLARMDQNRRSLPSGFDEDFLWIFRQLPRIAFALSAEYAIVELTELMAQQLGVESRKLVGKNFAVLLAGLGYSFAISIKGEVKIKAIENLIRASAKLPQDECAKLDHLLTKLINHPWQSRAKYAANGEIMGWICYEKFVPDSIEPPAQAGEGKNLPFNHVQIVEQLAREITHDLRTPLAVIGINTDLIKLDVVGPQKNEKMGGYLKNIEEAVSLVAGKINNFSMIMKALWLEKPPTTHYASCSIREDLEIVFKKFPFCGQERSLIEIQAGPSSDFNYYGDRQLVQQLIFSLVKNMLKTIKEEDQQEGAKIVLDHNAEFNLLRVEGINDRRWSSLNEYFEGKIVLDWLFFRKVMQSLGGYVKFAAWRGESKELGFLFPKSISMGKING